MSSLINIKDIKIPADILMDLLYTEIKIDNYIDTVYLDIRQDRRVGYWCLQGDKLHSYTREGIDFMSPRYPEYTLHHLFEDIK